MKIQATIPKQKKRKLLPFKESQLLKGLNAKKAHADEIATLIKAEKSLANENYDSAKLGKSPPFPLA